MQMIGTVCFPLKRVRGMGIDLFSGVILQRNDMLTWTFDGKAAERCGAGRSGSRK